MLNGSFICFEKCFEDTAAWSFLRYLSKLDCNVVPSTKRAAAVEEYGQRAEDELEEEGDGWFATPHDRGNASVEEIPSSETDARQAPTGQPAHGSDSEEIPDIDDLVLEDNDGEVKRLTFLLPNFQRVNSVRRFSIGHNLHAPQISFPQDQLFGVHYTVPIEKLALDGNIKADADFQAKTWIRFMLSSDWRPQQIYKGTINSPESLLTPVMGELSQLGKASHLSPLAVAYQQGYYSVNLGLFKIQACFRRMWNTTRLDNSPAHFLGMS